VKVLIKKILAQKLIIGLVLLAVGLPGLYLLISIYHSVQKMQSVEEVTYFPAYPSMNFNGKDANLIKKGEYLAKAGDCIACHTNTYKKGKPFAGGLPMYTPFGTIYTPNITPDKKTGIGGWTDEQFIKAMREGISPQGHYYYPAFPYLYFSKITIEDLKAIKAYLDSIPAVEQQNRNNEMIWPFNWRFLQLGWRLLFFYKEDTDVFQPDINHSDQWNRGAYLASGLGHCAMCHSPSYHLLFKDLPLGAPIRKYNLTGGSVQGFLAPNITTANLSTVPVQEIVDVFTKDRMIGGGKIQGPMLEVNRDSLSHLSPADLTAIATYLKEVQSAQPPKPSYGSGGAGKGIYEQYCSACHATGAGGAPKYGNASDWSTLLPAGMDKVYKNAIDGYGGMPAKGTCISCTDDEIKLAVDYMVAPVQGKAAAPAATSKKLTLADGERIYQTNCSVCHITGFNGAPKPGDTETWKPIIKKGFVSIYEDVKTGKHGHPPHGACANCSDAELIAAIKYMLTASSTTENFNLW
jgi:cytochrome c5